MRKIAFPYILNRPIIPIQIKNVHENAWITTEGYVDSGASFSIFSIKETIRLGIAYQNGKEIFATVGDGGSIPVYLHTLPIKIGPIYLKATIGFSPRLGVGFNLIGRKDIFDQLDITFSDSTETISFTTAKHIL